MTIDDLKKYLLREIELCEETPWSFNDQTQIANEVRYETLDEILNIVDGVEL